MGLATRFWALALQSLAITLSVLNSPIEWHWSYFLMMMVHLAIFATAAGRSFGVCRMAGSVIRPGDRGGRTGTGLTGAGQASARRHRGPRQRLKG